MKEIYPQGSVCLAPSASTFPLLHVEPPAALQPLDGPTGFSSAAPVTQKIESLKQSCKQRAQLNRSGENTILVLQARRLTLVTSSWTEPPIIFLVACLFGFGGLFGLVVFWFCFLFRLCGCVFCAGFLNGL